MAVNIEQILNSLSTDSNSNIKHQQEIILKRAFLI